MDFRESLLCFFAIYLSLVGSFRIKTKYDIANSCVQCHETDPNKINVHLVHHSHDDVGWLKTVDEYYWGLNKTYENVGVQYIITSVVNSLLDHPDRRYIQVETAFFWKWWKTQDDIMRNKFRTLVENGQLEIVNGAWSMNDEACVSYQSTIDQFTWGFRVLNETLGECGNPTIGWQIDPFGHSREHASILSKIGFDGLFFARLDNSDREQRKKDHAFDLLWKNSANNDDVLFTSMFGPNNLYYPPSGFCFDVLCGDDSIVDDPDEDAYNLDAKVKEFADDIKSYVSYYKTNHIIILMGGDFQYEAAEINFQNSERLIKGFKNNTEIKLIYSTPSCYLQAVYEEQPELITKTDDFFPYGSANHSYWAGYFTSKQNFKRFERIGHNTLQVAKQLSALVSAANQTDVNVDSIKQLREVMGIVQHHDSITGTEKDHVAHDYAKILTQAVYQAEASFSGWIGNLLDISLDTDLMSCLLANISICTTTQSSDEFLVVVYNPLAWTVNYPVRLPIESGHFIVRASDGEISSDIVAPISNFSYVNLSDFQPAQQELVFLASDIPPLGFKVYLVNKTNELQNTIEQNLDNTFKFGNEEIGFEIDNSTNLLKSVTMNGQTLQITQQFLHYTSHNGTNDSDPSGAYIFRPNGEAVAFGNPTIVSRIQGNVVEEVHQRFNDWITQIIRVYTGSQNYIEFDWLVGPLNVSNSIGIEIITRFTVENFENNQIFYTDSNSRESIKRVLNYRPTYSYNSSIEPVASNYYPVTSKISIRDETRNLQVSVLNDRSQGGTSLGEGQIELMVHRRTLKDDNKGVGEALNEMEFDRGIVARGQHYLILGPSWETLNGKTVTAQERIVAQQKILQPWVGVVDSSKLSSASIAQLLSINYSALKKSLPDNVNLLTLEPWTNSSYILRLEHIMEIADDPNLSAPVTVDLADLFSGYTVINIVETTLGANHRLDSLKKRYDWTYKAKYPQSYKLSLAGSEVVLGPMDIKTFLVQLSE